VVFLTIKDDAAVLAQDPEIRTAVYDDREVCPQGLQPFLYSTAEGTLLLQYQSPEKPLNSRVLNYPFGTATLVSRDDGATFAPYFFREGMDAPFLEAGAVTLPDGRFFFMDTYAWATPAGPAHFASGETWWSADDLRTLTGPGKNSFSLPDADFYGSSDDDGRKADDRGGCRLHRSTLCLPNGDLLVSMYGCFSKDKAPAGYEPRMMKTRVWVARSRDGGAHFETLSTVAADAGIGTEGFGEPVLVRVEKGLHAGRILCLMRTGRDLYEAHSDDDGASWSYFARRTFPGADIYDLNAWRGKYDGKYENVNPLRHSLSGSVVDPDVIQMKNGLLACSFGVRIPAQLCWEDPSVPNNGVFCAFSKDGGDTWSHVVRVMGGHMTTNYTALREAKNGDILFAYDVGAWRQGGRGGRLCRIRVDC